MTIQFDELAAAAAADGAISPEDILALRRAGWSDGAISPGEAEAIFAINGALAAPGAEWSDFFVEAIGEFVVNRLEPRGYVTPENGDWLIARIDRNGRVDSLTELELLVRVFEKASGVPADLRAYALEQVGRAVLEGTGPTRDGGVLERGNVTAAEARIMRRIVFSQGSERPAGVSEREAELLFRIKDATLGADNAPEWKALFVQGVGNFLAGYTVARPLTAQRAVDLEAFVRDSSTSIGRFFTRMATDRVTTGRFGEVFGRQAPGRDFFAEAEKEREITDREQAWLDARIAANGLVDEYDRALLEFLAEG